MRPCLSSRRRAALLQQVTAEFFFRKVELVSVDTFSTKVKSRRLDTPRLPRRERSFTFVLSAMLADHNRAFLKL